MSQVQLTPVHTMRVHPNADHLEIVQVLGTQVVVPKGLFKLGELVAYVPHNTLLHPASATALGVTKYLKHGVYPGQKQSLPTRVAVCRIRGVPSYGFVTKSEGYNYHNGRLQNTLDVDKFFTALPYEPNARKIKTQRQRKPSVRPPQRDSIRVIFVKTPGPHLASLLR